MRFRKPDLQLALPDTLQSANLLPFACAISSRPFDLEKMGQDGRWWIDPQKTGQGITCIFGRQQTAVVKASFFPNKKAYHATAFFHLPGLGQGREYRQVGTKLY